MLLEITARTKRNYLESLTGNGARRVHRPKHCWKFHIIFFSKELKKFFRSRRWCQWPSQFVSFYLDDKETVETTTIRSKINLKLKLSVNVHCCVCAEFFHVFFFAFPLLLPHSTSLSPSSLARSFASSRPDEFTQPESLINSPLLSHSVGCFSMSYCTCKFRRSLARFSLCSLFSACV